MISICGGAPLLTEKRPENWLDIGYRIFVPFTFKWREKIGKFECNCKVVEEWYQPWYGFTWFHEKDCALMKQVRFNETRFGWKDVGIIAQSE